MNQPPSFAGVHEGAILAGKYRIDKVLGAGGMGVVVAAHHIHLDERVAIKFLLPEMLASGEAVARFAREARAAVKIKSEHVARVADVGTLENGAPYMVMEFLEGSDLGHWLRERGRLDVEQASYFVLQACEAIAEAHSIGIVHRDLKPPNLFVIRRPDGGLSVKVLDFGISKMRGMSSSVPEVSITKTSAIMGSPLYMSPEQMQSAKDVDSRTDIWALGIILYELVTGQSPFLGDSVHEVVAKIISMPPVPLRDLRPDAPPGFEAVILKCIEKDRGRRYESVGELAAALFPFAPRRSRISLERISGVMRSAGLSATALATPPSSDPTEPAGETQGAFGRTNPSPGGKTKTLIGATTLLALGGGALFFFQKPPAATTVETIQTVATEPPKPVEPVNVPMPVALPAPKPTVEASAASSVPVVAAAPSIAAPSPVQPGRTKVATRKPREVAAPKAGVAPSPSPPATTVSPMPAAPPKPKAPGAFDDRK